MGNKTLRDEETKVKDYNGFEFRALLLRGAKVSAFNIEISVESVGVFSTRYLIKNHSGFSIKVFPVSRSHFSYTMKSNSSRFYDDSNKNPIFLFYIFGAGGSGVFPTTIPPMIDDRRTRSLVYSGSIFGELNKRKTLTLDDHPIKIECNPKVKVYNNSPYQYQCRQVNTQFSHYHDIRPYGFTEFDSTDFTFEIAVMATKDEESVVFKSVIQRIRIEETRVKEAQIKKKTELGKVKKEEAERNEITNRLINEKVEQLMKIKAGKEVGDLVEKFEMKSKQFSLFLSHHKADAGLAAVLLRKEMSEVTGISRDKIFLDTENLKSLSDIKEKVANSSCMIVILTRSTLTRPWCLIELSNAIMMNIRILPVHLKGGGFNFEEEANFLRSPMVEQMLDERNKNALKVLVKESVDIRLVSTLILDIVLGTMAVEYDPISPDSVRLAQVSEMVKKINEMMS